MRAYYGLLFAIFPLLLAFGSGAARGKSMWDEAEGGGGYIWLLMITAPVGIVWFIVFTLLTLLRRSFP